ncbi:MAG: H-type lectin domain-containing protein [Candidatus Cloacimonetes bacterium]|jgi:hypothetical protein|nr:H-type lectin domain-containing protein [Candidatus Cloacimonadota bacterium]
MAIQTNPHIPTFVLLPVNNNRTAYRSFGLPIILMETDRRDLSGAAIDNSGIIVQGCTCDSSGEYECMGEKTSTCNDDCAGAAVRIVIEDVPHKALVAGQIPIGLMSPDHEIFAKSISMSELISRTIHPELQIFFRITGIDSNGNQVLTSIEYAEAVGGDLMQYTTASGSVGNIEYYPTANYYDLSDITIDVETLPPDWYNLSYQAQYYARVESQSTSGQLNCIDITRTAVSVYRFRMNHPGQVMQETVRLTPPPYLTSDKKSEDTTIEFYRPFTDILQDIFDEQYLLGSINWVDNISPQFVPYLCYLLGLDLPYFPQSVLRLRKTMLRNVVRLQQLKGSRNAIYDLFEMFGYIVYVNKLYWSKDGKRLIRPGEVLPPAYSDQEITLEEKCQIEPVLVGYNTSGFGDLTIPLLYRPSYIEEIQGIVTVVEDGEITLNSYLVRKNALGSGTVSTYKTTNLVGNDTTFLTDFVVGDTITVTGETARTVASIIDDENLTVTSAFSNTTSAISYTYVSKTYKKLEEVSCKIGTSTTGCDNDPSKYNSSNCTIPTIPTDGLDSWSQVVIKRSTDTGDPSQDVSTGTPPFTYHGVSIDRKANLLHLTFDSAIQFDDKYGLQGTNAPNSELMLYSFAVYNHEVVTPPDDLKNLFSNRFDIQLLTHDGSQVGSDVLEFLIDYLFKLKAFHSLLHTLIFHSDFHETYQVTPFCVGGDLEQRYDIDAGKLQVPPAIIPITPTDNCSVDPSDLGYKDDDIRLRNKILSDLPDEFDAWTNVREYMTSGGIIGATGPTYIDRDVTQIGDERLSPTPANGTTDCRFTYRGQDRVITGDDTENISIVYDPTPLSNNTSIASQSTTDLCPIHDVIHGSFYPTGPNASSNNDSSKYSAFTRNFTTSQNTLCKLDGTTDYCYKGRVGDDLLCTMTMMNVEQHQATICQINFGNGIYYAFPSTSELTNSIQGPMLKQSYNTNLSKKNNNFLDRLFRAYDTSKGENIHYTDRPFLTNGVSGESNLLALQRSGLGIQVPLMHFPGTRFATVNKLETDFVHDEWTAKPWDDAYSTSCGPYGQSCYKPTYLNAVLENDTAGNQHLVYDNVPFTIVSNGLQPDIPNFGSHALYTSSSFSDTDVIHSIYTSITESNIAITLDSTSPPSRTIAVHSANYTHGGLVWNFNHTFNEIPTITVGIELIDNTLDSLYPLSAKIISVSTTSAVIKVYKMVLDGVDLVCSECATNDVVVHLKACTSDIIISTDQPLFKSASKCDGSDGIYVDYIDGYPSSVGYQQYIPDDFDRSGMYTELFDELGIDRSMPTGTEVLFFFISGIRYTTSYRMDCGCSALSCNSGTSETVMNCTITDFQEEELPFEFSDGIARYGYNYNPDKIQTDITLSAEEKIGVGSTSFDGQLIWDDDLQSYRQMNMFELCTGFPTCSQLA